MKLKPSIKNLALCAVLGMAAPTQAATVTVDPGATWLGFMNVFERPSNGGGFVFNSGWGTADLSAVFVGPTLTLSPNSINDPNPFWYTPAGGPGAIGNKTMDASFYVQTPDGSLSGQTLTFTGIVLSTTFTSAHVSTVFIKDFAPDYSSFVLSSAPVVDGVFSISLALDANPLRHVQYGFQTIGENVWVTDLAPFGSAQITAIPEPASITLAGLGTLALLVRRRRM
ncbi:MAG: PEP-CTERM sorting domain-containing protein [Luteolibacter sp.]